MSEHSTWKGFVADPPNALYHYTGAPVLQSMLDSKILWATSTRTLNDPYEMIVGANAFEQALTDFNPQNKWEEDIKCDYSARINRIKMLGYPLFITSFSASPHCSALWKKYAGNGTGYAIGLAVQGTAQHGAASSPEHPRYAEVAYSTDLQLELDHARAALQHARNEIASDGQSGLIRGKQLLNTVWCECLSCFKSASWSDEEEWRATVYTMDGPWLLPDGTEVEIWDPAVSKTLHIEIPLRVPEISAEHLPIVEVVLGKHNVLTEDQVRELLAKSGIKHDCRVYRTETDPAL